MFYRKKVFVIGGQIPFLLTNNGASVVELQRRFSYNLNRKKNKEIFII